MRLICIETMRVGIERKISGQCDCGARMFESIQIKSILIQVIEIVLN
jgi:hypothetical protein